MNLKKKQQLLQKRRWRIRKIVKGTTARPRLVVTFTNKHIYAQCIDDDQGATQLAISSLAKDLRGQSIQPNVEGATKLGQILGERAIKKGLNQVVFDRAGRAYHGCVKAFADAARSAGLQF